MLVHPVSGPDKSEPSALKILRDQLGQHIYPIHRLDQPTSGVLVFALEKTAAGITQQAFEKRQVTKTYLAIVTGATPDSWTCDAPLEKNPTSPPKPAKTSFETLQRSPKNQFPEDPGLILSLIKASPLTGRYHQIRRHLLESGYPIVGDFRYAGIERSLKLSTLLGTNEKMLLQASCLEIQHPITGEPLKITTPANPNFRKCFPAMPDFAA